MNLNRDTNRRSALIAGSGAVATALAGCSEVFGNSESPVQSIGESYTTDDTTVTLTETAVQTSFLRTLADPIWEPIPLGLQRYAFAHVEVVGTSPPEPGEFELVTKQNDETVSGTAHPEVGPTQRIHERDPRYAPQEGVWSGWIAFVTDVDEPEKAYIEWEGNRWALPDADRRALGGGVPAFEYEALEVPEQISRGDSLEIQIDVRNESDSYSGICRGALHVMQPRPSSVTPAETAELFQVEIEPGQTGTWTAMFEGEFTQNLSRLHLHLKSHAGDREFTIDIP